MAIHAKTRSKIQYSTVLYSTVQTGSDSDWFRFMPVLVPTGSQLTEPGSWFLVRFRGFPDKGTSSDLALDIDAAGHLAMRL